MKTMTRIIVTGLIAQHYTLAGVSWDYMQYCIGLHQMGYDVYYIEDSGEWPYNFDGGPHGDDWVEKDCVKNISYLRSLFDRYGMQDRWSYFFPLKSEWYGMSDEKRREVISTADLLINVSGTLEKPEKYTSVKRLAYVDSDPGFTQVKIKLNHTEFTNRITAHHCHFSFGECIPDHLQDERLHWKPTRTPIVLSEWPANQPYQEKYTTVMNWTSYKPMKFAGKSYHQKDIEFIRFIELKRKLKNVCLEVALSKLQHSNWQTALPDHFAEEGGLAQLTFSTPADMLTHYGWKVVDPSVVCGNPDSYRDYIIQSKGEWSVAKGGYANAKPGWFSCRSACYLAAGRPVIVQDTGFDKVIPTGEGIFTFNTTEEALQHILELEANYGFHAKRARELAEEYFDASKVLQQLITTAMES